ncbi:MAG: 4Fe-4S dicluster domain-containing protein, partial [Candidatus Methanomethylophilaceae archaeon]|nr:4Fe-4S dicluster domain-containing protein [Candidatus Methanomethylophilaceae archaeon]
CAKVCPVNAIEMVEKGVNDKGRPIVRPSISVDKCISCSNCVDACPKSALEIKEVL